MKNILSVLLCLTLIFSFAACSAPKENGPESALILLENVWAKYEDTEKFAAGGGDFSAENQKMDAPGKYGLEDKEALMSTFCLDEKTADLVDDAASLMHMMLANNFTAVSLHVSSSADVNKVADSLKENLANNRWLCGFPEKMYIATVDDYVVSVFGAADLLDTFDGHLKEVYTNTEVLYDEPIA